MALALVSVVAAESCGFPDHQFIPDEEFRNRGKTGPDGGGAPFVDASMMTAAGGIPGSGGTSGAGTGGTRPGNGGSRVGQGPEAGIAVIPDGSRSGGDGGAPGTGGTQATDGGPVVTDSGPGCAPGLTLCGDTCVDELADNAHCGTCTTVCTGTDVCTGGTCAPPCGPGLSACTSTGNVKVCVDTTLDENNCGACGKACPSGTVCDGSTCLVDCGTLVRCGAQCIDTTTDDTHCGDCNTNCKSISQVCSGSVCKPSCTTPFVACGNTCVDTTKDDTNCGGCGKPCPAKQGCSASVCKPLVENCLNGVDDDRDGLIDCADPDCNAGYTCGSVPAGWQGPFALWSGTTNAAPTCPSTYPSALFLAHDQLKVPAYTCPDCNCSPSGDAKCNTLHYWYDTSNNCTASAAWDVAVDPDGVCVQEDLSLYGKNLNPLSLSIDSAQLTPPDRHTPALPPYAQGTCGPNQVAPKFPDATWGLDAEGCGAPQSATTGGGCSVGACMTRPTTPFGGKLCIFKAGVTSCPSSYPVSPPSPQYYETWTEGRKCSSCSCGSLGCGGTVTAFTDLDCSENPTTIAADGTCAVIPKDPTPTGSGISKHDTLSIRWDDGGPVCGKGASGLLGAATPDSPITVCCQQ